MGYRENGEPSNITFITRSNNEQLLYNVAYLFENLKHLKIAINFNKNNHNENIYIILLSIRMISLSCETPDTSPQVIGFTTSEEGKTDEVAGPDDINAVWESYIDAHNSRIQRELEL